MKEGDVVQFQSGGLPMTVEAIFGDAVTCIWFGRKQERAVFQLCTLKPYQPSPKGQRANGRDG